MTFFSHRPGSSDFSHIFHMFTMLNVVYDHFLTRKTQFFTLFHRLIFSVHAFTHIRQHYFSKYWGTNAWAVPHLKVWGDRPPVPPRSPPLRIGLSLVQVSICRGLFIYIKHR